MKNIKIIFIWLLLVVASMQSGYSQVPDASANFVKVEKEINTTPEFPGICDSRSGVEVTVNEDFDEYLWYHPFGTSQTSRIPLSGKTVRLKETGTWRLVCRYTVNGVPCSETKDLFVADLKEPSQIQKYFENAGFYAVDISRNIPSGPASGPQCDPDNISFGQGQKEALRPLIQGVFDNFKPITSLGGGSMVLSENNCLCSEGVDKLEEQFNTGALSVWAHQFFATTSVATGKLFIKGRMPFDDALPIPTQKSHLASIHGNILSANGGISEQGRVIFSNLFMPHPIGGYEPEDLCDLTGPIDPEAFYLTPAGVPIKLPTGSYNEVFTDEENSEGIFEGSLIKFNINSIYYHGYLHNEKKFAGYYYDIKAEIKDDFDTGNHANGDITYIIPETDCNECYPTYGASSQTSGVRINVSDGGVNLEIWQDLQNISNWLIHEKEVRETVLDLICAIKHGESSFTFPSNLYSHKILLAKDIYLNNSLYDYLGVSIPPFVGTTISLIATPIINTEPNSPNGFKDGIQFGVNSFFRFACFSRVCSASKKGLKNYAYHRANTNTYYDVVWPKVSTFLLEKKFKPSPIHNLALKIYLNNEGNNDNLLIFANGYRMNLSLTTDNPKTDDKLRCSDSYKDSGPYWGSLDNEFIERIGTRNVYYADGHDAITTSNHNDGGDIFNSKIKFAYSALSSYCAAGKLEYGLEIMAKLSGISGVILGNFICEPSCVGNPSCVHLNTTSNFSGFGDRQGNGFVYGVDLVNKIKSGKVKIKKDANGKVIGKIDIVAHSMGFAYAYGISRALLEDTELGITQLGNFYVLAPENGCAAVAINLGKYESIWQYGTAENGSKPHLAWERDGVAPQCPIPGLNWNQSPYGRVKFQGQADFIQAHVGSSYGWVLSKLETGDNGYVQPRN